MPTYEYECGKCHLRFEKRQRVTEDPISVCPDCGGETRRVIYPVGVIFKGSGFYCTDNRSSGGSGRSSESAAKPAESGSESGSGTNEAKSVDKPADTSGAKAPDNTKVTAGTTSS